MIKHPGMEAEDTGSSGLKSSPKEESIQANNTGTTVNIKEEPLDSMPPLASPATVVNVVSTNATANGADKQRDLEPSPPATVISLAPAQPYPTGTQLTFAAPAYDIEATGPYTVQVNFHSLSLSLSAPMSSPPPTAPLSLSTLVSPATHSPLSLFLHLSLSLLAHLLWTLFESFQSIPGHLTSSAPSEGSAPLIH